jgi:acrylyl-CoA reductase (NADPH)
MTRAIVVSSSGPALSDAPITPEETGEPLGPGEALVDVRYSSLNYKDGLALAGDPGVKRIEPLVPGIDVVGRIVAVGAGAGAGGGASSGGGAGDDGDAGDVLVGRRVVVTGAGLGETRNGGYAWFARVPLDALVALDDAMTDEHAAAIGTAGFTAMLSVLALERNVRPMDGPILVTGSSGGVGSVAIALLAGLGYEVVASTGRTANARALQGLGAAEVIDRVELQEPGKPMQRARWAGAIDSVGGSTLANVLAQTRWGGTVTACGLAQDARLDTTVLPFILRAVSLVGIDSVSAPLELRRRAWARLGTDLDPTLLDGLTTTVGLADAIGLGPEVLAGRIRGRTVVDLSR